MSKHLFLAVLAAALTAMLSLSPILRADAYAPPVCEGAWAYVYSGDQAVRDPDGCSAGRRHLRLLT